MEAEVRSILADTLVPPPGEEFDPRAIQDYVRGLYEGQLPSGVVDELIAERRAEAAREP